MLFQLSFTILYNNSDDNDVEISAKLYVTLIKRDFIIFLTIIEKYVEMIKLFWIIDLYLFAHKRMIHFVMFIYYKSRT